MSVIQNDTNLLEKLPGKWRLTCIKGQEQSVHEVYAHWSLNNQFVVMEFREETGPYFKGTPYEAVYYIGIDKGQYIMHLLDVFGAAYSRTLGIGKQEGNSIEFIFRYPDGPFHNTFTYDAGAETWAMALKFRNAAGEWQTFANKVMRRI